MKNFLLPRSFRFCFIGSLVLALVLPATAATRFSEEAIPMGAHKNDERVFDGSVQISDDKQHITYVSRNQDGKVRVWIDGITGVAYDGTSTPRFAPGTDRVAYIAADKGKMFTIIDGKKGPEYANADSLVFAPDGERFAYRAQEKKGEILAVVDGKPGPPFTNILPDPGIVFSPDSRHFVYIGINEAGSQVLVKNHAPMRAFDQISQVIFSPDSSHLAYAGRSGTTWSVVHDNRDGRGYDTVTSLLFSPDSKHLAYVAQQKNRVLIIKDDKEVFSGESAGAPFFSPCDSRLGYIIRKNSDWHVVLDGKKGAAVGRPVELQFSQDCRNFAYSTRTGDTWSVIKNAETVIDGLSAVRFLSFLPESSEVVYIATTKEGKEYISIAGKKGKPYDSIGLPVVNPAVTGEVCYAVKNGDAMFMVENGTEHISFKFIGILMKGEDDKVRFSSQYPFFSSDGRHMAYPAVDTENRKFMVVDGRPQEYYQAITEPVFSPDGSHIAYTAQKNGKWLVVVDGIEGKQRFDAILKGGGIVFDSPSSFYVLTLNLPGPSFYKLAVTIGEDKKQP